MAETITFRPAAGIVKALDRQRRKLPRTAVINAALAQYLGVEIPQSGGPSAAPARASTSGRAKALASTTRAKVTGQATARSRPAPGRSKTRTPAKKAAGGCAHPHGSRVSLGYATKCGACGKVLR